MRLLSKRHMFLLAALIAIVGLLTVNSIRPARAENDAVSIQNLAFNPASLTVSVGATVTWTDNDPFDHTATSDTGAFDTGPIASGQTASATFDTAGTFTYHCSIHPYMHGTIVVQTAAPTSTSTAPPATATQTLVAPTATSPAPTPTSTSAAPTATSGGSGFTELVDRANVIAGEGFISNGLLEANGTPNRGRGTSAESVQSWRFIFSVRGAGCKQGLLTIFYRQGAFTRQFVCTSLPHNRIIPLPLNRDLSAAIDVLHRAGFRETFDAVTVRWPTNAVNKEPFYLFDIPSGVVNVTLVFVGVDTGTVHVERRLGFNFEGQPQGPLFIPRSA